MTNQQAPAALRLAEELEIDPSINRPSVVAELRRLHAENVTLQQGYDAARLEIDSLQSRVQELGAMLRENRSKRIVELEAQLEAIGAGGVEPLRRRECLHKISEPGVAPEHALKDVRCGRCGYMTYHREHIGCIRAAAPTTKAATAGYVRLSDVLDRLAQGFGASSAPVTTIRHHFRAAAPTTQAAPAAQGDAPTDSGPISRQWLTVVYRGVEAGDEVQQICTHPKVSAMSWSHALHDRDAARSQAKEGGAT